MEGRRGLVGANLLRYCNGILEDPWPVELGSESGIRIDDAVKKKKTLFNNRL
jgi:hypothetical protein